MILLILSCLCCPNCAAATAIQRSQMSHASGMVANRTRQRARLLLCPRSSKAALQHHVHARCNRLRRALHCVCCSRSVLAHARAKGHCSTTCVSGSTASTHPPAPAVLRLTATRAMARRMLASGLCCPLGQTALPPLRCRAGTRAACWPDHGSGVLAACTLLSPTRGRRSTAAPRVSGPGTSTRPPAPARLPFSD